MERVSSVKIKIKILRLSHVVLIKHEIYEYILLSTPTTLVRTKY